MENFLCSEDKSRSCVVKIVPSSRTLKSGSLDRIRLADLRHSSRFTAGRHSTAMSGSTGRERVLRECQPPVTREEQKEGRTLNTCPSETWGL